MRKNTEEYQKLMILRSERLKSCFEKYGLKQVDIFKKGVGTEGEASDWMNGKRLLTEAKIEDIRRELLPEVSKSYLLGDCEYMTENERICASFDFKNAVADSMWGVIEKSLKKQGKSLKFIHHIGEHIDATERLHSDCWYEVVDKDGKLLKKMTALEMVQFEEKIQEYVDFLTLKDM